MIIKITGRKTKEENKINGEEKTVQSEYNEKYSWKRRERKLHCKKKNM